MSRAGAGWDTGVNGSCRIARAPAPRAFNGAVLGIIPRSRHGIRRASSCRMPVIRSHQDFVALQLCVELADLIIEITATVAVTKDAELCDQIRRSSGAPGPHIAEGFGRFKPREFAHYLRMAVGSLMETETWLQRGKRNGYWKRETFDRAKSLCDRALDMTRKLLASKVRQIEEEDRQKANRRGQRVRSGGKPSDTIRRSRDFRRSGKR